MALSVPAARASKFVPPAAARLGPALCGGENPNPNHADPESARALSGPSLRISSKVSIMTAPSRIQIADIDGVTVIRFNDHQLFDERTVREVAEQIAVGLPTDGSPIRLILD